MTQRTDPQNRSLHKWATLMSGDLNAAGFDQRVVMEQFKEGFDVPWTMDAVKNIFRTVAKAMYQTDSTAELDTVQIQRVYEVVDARLSEITGVRHEWPSLESMSEEQRQI